MEIQRRDGEIRQDTVVYKTLSGGYKLHAMVHYPREWRPEDKRPVFFCSYGSGWRGGKYASDPKGDKYLSRWEPKCDDMALKGMVCVRYDYRASGKADGFSNSVVAMISDARSVVRWIRRNAGELGVDTGRICGAGGSSGFHITVSGTVFESKEYNQPGENPDLSPKAHALIGFTGALCNSSPDGRIKNYCPRDSLKAGGPAFLGIVGGKDSWRGGVELFAEKAYSLHIPALIKMDPSGGHDFHVGVSGRGSTAGYNSSMGWAQDFLFSIGHMDWTLECRPGGKVNLETLSRFIRDYCAVVDTLGPCEDVQYKYAGGGGEVNAAGVFTSSGQPGMFMVTAHSAKHPHISRRAVIRVPVLMAASAASSIQQPVGFTGVYAKVKSGAGGEAVFAVKHQGGNSAVKLATKSLSNGFHYIGAFPFDGKSPGSITVTGTGGGAVDSLMLVPAYSGSWENELTSAVQPKTKRHLQSNLGENELEFFSLSGKKLDKGLLFHPGTKKNLKGGVYIIRNKQNGRTKLAAQLPH